MKWKNVFLIVFLMSTTSIAQAEEAFQLSKLNYERLERIKAKQAKLQEELNAEKKLEAQKEFMSQEKLIGEDQPAGSENAEASLEDMRLTMDKWIETQQIISKERKDWQQGKEILLGRLDLVKKEVATLEEKTKAAQSSVAEADKKRDELTKENDQLKEAGNELAKSVTAMEAEVRKLFKSLPEPVQTKLQPLYQRVPENPEKTNVSVAERYQNILGILNELNKANNEITVNYEVHDLTNGKPSEVKAIYVGLAQAYYVSASGEGGIGRPTADGWKWEPSKTVARDVLLALEILEGKHSPAFVPLPVELQ